MGAALLRYGDRSVVSDDTSAAAWELSRARLGPVHLTLHPSTSSW